MSKRLYLIFFPLILILLIVSTGCWDKRELEEKAYVVDIGLDPSDKEGLISVTFHIANPQVGTSQRGESQREPASEEITFPYASDIFSAKDTANAIATRTLTFQQVKMIIISEELARSNDFLRVMYSIVRDPELRRGTHIMITKEKASEFIKNNKPLMETRPHKHYQFMIERTKETGLVPDSDIHKFFAATESDESLFLAMYGTTLKTDQKKNGYEDEYLPGEIPHVGGNQSQLVGSAVFKKGKMIGTLTGEETRLALRINPYEAKANIYVTYKDPKNPKFRISARVLKSEDVDVKVDAKAKKPTVKVKVPVNIELLGIPSMVNYIDNLENQKLLEKSIKEGLEKKMNHLVERSQKEFKGDLFKWSLAARRNFTTLKNYKEYDWEKHFPDLKVEIEVEIKIKRFGKQLKEPEIK